MLIDYHVHSKFSPDSEAGFEELAENAVRNGIDEIAITDHYEMDKNGNCSYDVDGYFEELYRLRRDYEGKLVIRAGVEIGNTFFDFSMADSIVKYPYDFVLASAHDLGGCDLQLLDRDDSRHESYYDLQFVDFKSNKLHEVIRIYLEKLEEIVEWGKFDCLAHFDLPVRYAINQGVKLDFSVFNEKIEKILHKLLEHGNKGLELNISGWIGSFCSGFKDTMPSKHIMKMWQRLGGRIVTVGTDSHQSQNVGKYARKAQEFLLECGFSEIAIFEKHQPKMHSIKL